MQGKKLIYIIGGIVLLLTLLFYLAGSSSYNWQETYTYDNKEPYGVYVLPKLLENFNAADSLHFVRDTFPVELMVTNQVSNYVFIGNQAYYAKEDLDRLLSFIANGNTALISTRTCPYQFIEKLMMDCSQGSTPYYKQIKRDSVFLNLNEEQMQLDNALKLYLKKNKKINTRYYNYIDPNVLCQYGEGVDILGRLNEQYTNFVRIAYGDGYCYLHTSPLAFSNYHLLTNDGKIYGERVLSYLSDGPIYYDTRRLKQKDRNKKERKQEDKTDSNPNSFNQEGPLQYVLAQPSLRSAWYLMLAMAFLYLIFRAKRKQRIIPVLEENRNESLSFIATIGRLSFMQNNHRKLAQQKYTLFLGYVKEQYNLTIKSAKEENIDPFQRSTAQTEALPKAHNVNLSSYKIDTTFAKQLAAKSGVSLVVIQDILIMGKHAQRTASISEEGLITYHQLLDHFYKNVL